MPPAQIDPKFVSSNVSSISSNKKGDKESIIIFDWDDTLLASSFLSSRGYRLDTPFSSANPGAGGITIPVEVEQGLRDLEGVVIALLTLACQYGDVNIITNAETGWIQLSAAKFMPGVAALLNINNQGVHVPNPNPNNIGNRIALLSARSTYEQHHPDSPLKWKYYAFQNRLAKALSDQKRHKNILSFGDSHVEREAVRAVTKGFANTRCKSVKFAERPSMEQLRRQVELVTNCFQYIHHHDGDLDLQLTVTINANQQQQQQQLQEKTQEYQSNQQHAIMSQSEEKPSS